MAEKLAKIGSEAAAEAYGPTDERDRRKVLIFSYFADTVAWVNEFLEGRVSKDPGLAVYEGRTAAVSGDDSLATIFSQLRDLGLCARFQ